MGKIEDIVMAAGLAALVAVAAWDMTRPTPEPVKVGSFSSTVEVGERTKEEKKELLLPDRISTGFEEYVRNGKSRVYTWVNPFPEFSEDYVTKDGVIFFGVEPLLVGAVELPKQEGCPGMHLLRRISNTPRYDLIIPETCIGHSSLDHNY